MVAVRVVCGFLILLIYVADNHFVFFLYSIAIRILL